jgi:Ala-tRNA(Pro) deacylase
MSVYQSIIDLLESRGVPYTAMQHEPVRTSEQAAQVRGTPLERGAKALVLECGDDLVLAVISASLRVDYKALKAGLGEKRVQMASAQRVLEATGCEPGGVPPFGNLLGLPVIVDPSILEQEWIDFNAGDRSRSVEMRSEDFVRIVAPRVIAFAGN